MKKYVMVLAMVFCMGGLLAGCGSKEKTEVDEQETETTEELIAPSLEGVKLDKIVTLGEYKGITIEKEIIEVTEAEVESELNYMLSMYPEAVTEGVVEEGDTIDIDFVGKIDGEEFDGGSAEGSSLTVGSGSYIEGFEEGLVGTTVGQNLDLNLTFPADFSEELGGKDVIFNVTVNSINRALLEATDEWVAANSEYKTVEECKEGIREGLLASGEENAEETMKSDAWQQVVESSTVKEYPADVEAYGVGVYKSQFETYAAYTGMSMEDYLKEQGVEIEEFNETAKEYGKTVADQVLVANAIAKKEKFEAGDDEYQKMLDEYLVSYDMTEEEFFAQYPKSNVDQSILLDRVRNLIMESAEIKEVKAEQPEDTTGAADEAAAEEATE